MEDLDRIASDKFREYLRIDTSHPNPNYTPAVDFLRQYAEELGLESDVYWCLKDKNPVVIMKWKGANPGLPSLLLNSHMDVVPVFWDQWTFPPFSAHKTENGDIYARGSQDMKCVGIQYLEAIRRLKKNGFKNFKRTIYLTFVPEEELSGNCGMDVFAFSDYFRAMNVGLSFDEGLANPGESFKLFYGERCRWVTEFRCPGTAGHASEFIENTAAEKLRRLMNSFLDFRESERKRMVEDGLLLGQVTSVNMTLANGGVQANVVPSEFTVTFDMRMSIDNDQKVMEERIEKWRKNAGEDVELHYATKHKIVHSLKPDPTKEWYRGFYKAVKELGIKVDEEIFPAGTDSSYLRKQGIPALGFSPMNNTPILLHRHDEYLNEKVFLRGVEIYEKIIAYVANE